MQQARKMNVGFSPSADPPSFAVNPFPTLKPRNPLKTFRKFFFPSSPIIFTVQRILIP